MAKQRSSLRGRGSETLFGTPSRIEMEPRDFEIPPAPGSSSLEVGQSGSKGSSTSSRPGGRQAEAGSAFDETSFITPEMERALYEEAMAAQDSVQPVGAQLIPAKEEPMEGAKSKPKAATNGGTASRSALGHLDMADPQVVAALKDIQSSGQKVDFVELPDRNLTEQEKEALLTRIGQARIQQLDEEISETYDQVLATVGQNSDIATECYNLLLKARDIVLRRDAAKFPQAEYYLELARARLQRAAESGNSAKKYAWLITTWGFVWGVIFLGALILLRIGWLEQTILVPNQITLSPEAATLLESMLWGGIGGVVAVWYSLFKHVGLRDFDAQYNLSYMGKPFLGLILGATVYMFFQLLLTLGFLPTALQTGSGDLTTVSPWIMFPLAWAGGFKENRIFDLVDRVIKQLFGGKEESSSQAYDAQQVLRD